MAQYIQGDDREQPMLLPAAIDDYVSPTSQVRAIDAFVESLDMVAMGFALRTQSAKGRSSYSPALLLKLYLWGYLKRTRSSRGLEQACYENLHAIWLTGNLRPDHSTIAEFRKNHPKALKQVLKEFHLVCFDLKLFGKELVAIDGTFIKALNSKAASFTKTKLKKLIAAIDEAITRYLERLNQADGHDGPTKSKDDDPDELRRKLAKIRERKALYEGYQEACEQSPTGQVNLSDPDARQLRKGGKSTIGYNVQSAVDARHHLIASIEVTQDGNDQHQLNAMAQQAKRDLQLPADAALKVLGDTGYGTGPEHAACEQNGTVALAPIQANTNDSNGLYNAQDFEHDPESDSYRCPQGHVLSRKADTKAHDPNGGYKTYYNAAACRECPVRSKCTKSAKRKLLISVHHGAVERAQHRLAAAPGAMRQRASLVEHPFGTIKHAHGYGGGLLCRGLALAGAEMSLSAWAYNFTRVLNLVGVTGLLEALRKRSVAQMA